MLVLPTARAVAKEVMQQLSTNGYKEKILTIDEFEKLLVLVENRVFIDNETRMLLLRKASEFENFHSLHIPREFFAFLKNSQYLFRFFEELSAERVPLESLESYDIYVEYEEHLNILQLLRQNYKNLLDEHGFIDKIFLPESYVLNHAYIQTLENVEIVIEGYFTNFEFELFLAVAKQKPLKLRFFANDFNEKMCQKFQALGFSCESGFEYLINLHTHEIEQKLPLGMQAQVECFSFNERILQCAFVKKKIYELIEEKGIEAHNIAVVLPNEEFKEQLALYDSANNLNFAMGDSVQKSFFLQSFTCS